MGKRKRCRKSPHTEDVCFLDRLRNKCDNGRTFWKLTGKEYEELWSNLYLEMLKNLSGSEDNEYSEAVVLIERACAKNALKASKSPSFLKILAALNEESMESSDEELKARICKINELWLANKDLPVVERMDVFTFRHLFKLVADADEPSISNMKRLSAFGLHASAELAEWHWNDINKLISHPIFITSEGGEEFLGRITALSEGIFNRVFHSIDKGFDVCKREIAVASGKILKYAWENADEVLKKTMCSQFQRLMDGLMKISRGPWGWPRRLANLMQFIDVWSVEVRKKPKDGFTKMIADCYQPIIWKYLQTGTPEERRAAVTLFLKAFPLQIPGDAKASKKLFDVQIEHMTKVLRDDCWVVRVAAICGILKIMPLYWSKFTYAKRKKLMDIIMNEERVDTSKPEVRCTVWKGLTNFVKHRQGMLYLKKIIPTKGDRIRDTDSKVRTAFIQLLIAIREEKHVPLSALIDVASCYTSLMQANQDEGSVIVKLLMPEIYHDEMPAETWFMNLCHLSKSPHTYRNFFTFSKNALPFEQAAVIMAEILHRLGKHVMIKAVPRNHDDEEDREIRSPNSNQSSSQSERNDSTVSSQRSGHTLDNCKKVNGLFNIVAILWSLHSVKIDEKAREELKKRKLNSKRKRKSNKGVEPTLHDICVSYVPRFISYYKGSEIFNSVVSLCGNIPMRMLTSKSISLPGDCIKKLKTMKTKDEVHVAVVALFKWGMGDQVIDEIITWLKATCTLPAAEDIWMWTPKRRKISKPDEPNSLMLTYIIDKLFDPEDLKPILMKHYDKILELWKMMALVKGLLLQRLLRKTPFPDSLLPDEFLTACFRWYLKMIPLLHKAASDVNPQPDDSTPQETPQPFDCKVELWSMIKWINDKVLSGHLYDDKTNCPELLVVNTLNDVLYFSEKMVAIHVADASWFERDDLMGVYSFLLYSKNGLHFMKGVSRAAAAITNAAYRKLWSDVPTNEKSEKIWTEMLPDLIRQMFTELLNRRRQDEYIPFIQDLDAMKKNLIEIFSRYKSRYDKIRETRFQTIHDRRILEDLASEALTHLREGLPREVLREDKTVPYYPSLASFPTALCVVITPFYKCNFWTDIFLALLRDHVGVHRGLNSPTVKCLVSDIMIIQLLGTKSAMKEKPSFHSAVWRAGKLLEMLKSSSEVIDENIRRRSQNYKDEYDDHLEEFLLVGEKILKTLKKSFKLKSPSDWLIVLK